MAPSKHNRSTPSDSVDGAIDRIDRYQLVERIGKGGMAEVFRAKLTGIGGFERDVALKVLLPSYAAEPEFVEMLLDEARIAGAILHPNVLQVLDVGRRGEIFYLVMEYIDGKDLRSIAKRLPGGRIPLGMALYIVSELLRGLNAVHTAVDERGQPRDIVHRDISPGNVMVDCRGFVKLGDFGIAHASGRITRTRVGSVKGKSRYMAPEQLAGLPVDARADLYAVGVTLFEAILGDFARSSSRPTIYGPMFTWPQQLPEGAIPRDVELILRRAITDTAEARYRDAEEMRADLSLALHRWAPGYGPDMLARDVARIGLSASEPIPVATVGVHKPRWRGVATAEHSVLAEKTSQPRPDATPLQVALASVTVTAPDLAPPVTLPEGFAELALPTKSEPRLDRVGRADLAKKLDRRLVAGLVVAALALVTVGIAALVAGTGGASVAAPAVEATAPRAALQPRAVPLVPTSVVAIDGDRAPAVEPSSGDHLARLPSGKKHRVHRGPTVALR